MGHWTSQQYLDSWAKAVEMIDRSRDNPQKMTTKNSFRTLANRSTWASVGIGLEFRKLEPELFREWMRKWLNLIHYKSLVSSCVMVIAAGVPFLIMSGDSKPEPLWIFVSLILLAGGVVGLIARKRRIPNLPGSKEFALMYLELMRRFSQKNGLDLRNVQFQLCHNDYENLEYALNPSGGYIARFKA